MAKTDSPLENLLSGGIKEKFPNANQSDLSKLLTPANINAATQTLTKLAKTAANALMGQASTVMGSSSASLASSFPSETGLFGDTNQNSKSLSTISQDRTYGTKETDSKMRTLASDSSGAIASPIAYLTKPISDAIRGTDSTVMGKRKKNMMEDMDDNDVSRLSNGAGFDITSSSDVTRAMNQVANTIASQFGSSSGFPSTSRSGSGSNSLLSGIAKTLGSITGSGTISTYLTSGAKIATQAYNALPTSLKQQIGAGSSSTILKVAQALLTDRSGSYSNILGKLGNTSYSDTLPSRTISLNNSYRYDGLTTQSGAPLTGYGNESSQDIDALYGAAASICPDVKQGGYTTYRKNKDLYDVLMQLAAELGMGDLMQQLNRCSNSGTYYDQRTSGILQSSSRTVAYNGDVNTYGVLTGILGPQNIPQSKNNLRVLNANMPGNRQNVDAYGRVVRTNGYDTEDLVRDDYYGRPVYSGRNTTLMSSSNTTVLDQVIGAGVRTLIVGAFSAYND